MRKILIGIALLVVVGGLVFANVRASRRKGLEVDVDKASKRDLVAQIEGSGRIEARRSVDIVANVLGKVEEVNVDEGDRVQKGQVILRIDPAERRAFLDQAKAAEAAATARETLSKAELRQAEQELARVRGLLEQGLASSQDLERSETNHDVRGATLAAASQDVLDAKARVQQAETELSRTVIRADISGIVVRLAVEEGENVLAGDLYNRGSAVVTIADLDSMEAHVLVDETEVVDAHAGQKATVEVDAFPGKKITGEVMEVGSSAYEPGALGSQEAKDFRVRILLKDPPRELRPGLSARAEIVTKTRDDALSVPIEALVLRDPTEQEKKMNRRGSKSRGGASAAESDTTAAKSDDEDREKEGVFLVKDGVAMFTPIETGIAGERHFEVLRGLDEGAQVIKGPFDALRRLSSGDHVRFRKESERSKREEGAKK